MSKRGWHLLHLAAVALFLYLLAFASRVLGATLAFVVLLPAGVIAELAFWVKLFSLWRGDSP